MIALDTETTGVDFHHGARPFYVNFCNEEGDVVFYEWDVDPVTRRPEIPPEDLNSIRNQIDSAKLVVMHNSKFDVRGIESLMKDFKVQWRGVDWSKVVDTVACAHILDSTQRKNLTDLSMKYLGEDIEPYEKDLEKAVKECRRKVQGAKMKVRQAKNKRSGKLPISRAEEIWDDAGLGYLGEGDTFSALSKWRISSEDDPTMPSATKDAWRSDYWLPRAYARYNNLPKDHPYWTILRDYANQDAPATMALYKVMYGVIENRGLVKVFQNRMKVFSVAYGMESRGLVMKIESMKELEKRYGEESESIKDQCIKSASEFSHEGSPFILEMPKGACPNNSMRTFFTEVMQLPPIYAKKSKTGTPTLDKAAMESYLSSYSEETREGRFLRLWADRRRRETYLSYMATYKRFWLADSVGYKKVYPRLNPCGTNTLRWSSQNPNEQSISKRGMFDGDIYTLRYLFGPGRGRVWHSFDAKNIELRLPAYESGQRELIDLFEHPDDPPFYGSEHLLTFSMVFDDIWNAELKEHGPEKVGKVCKKKYESTYYKRAKGGNFAIGYGAVDRPDGKGTADTAFGRPGAHSMLRSRFANKEKLNQRWIEFADKHGYVETIPDKTVDPTKGYPVHCERDERGRILPTVPLNYHIQSSAMQWTDKGMVRVAEFFEGLNRGEEFEGREWLGGYYIAIQQHDELVTDSPARKDPEHDAPIFNEVVRLMEMGGDDIGIPTPVGVERHDRNWSEGVTLK